MGGIFRRIFGIALAAGWCCLAVPQAFAQVPETEDVFDDAGGGNKQLETACDAGDMHSCKRLGDAYAEGQGVPRVAEVARILFRQACDEGLGDACNAIGELYLDRLMDGSTDPRLVFEYHSGVLPAFVRACKLESSQGCLNLASELQAHSVNTEYNALLAETCEAGDLRVCTQFAVLRLEQATEPADVIWGFSLLDAQCMSLDKEACDAAARYGWRHELTGDNRFPVWLELLCDFELAHRCEDRAKLAMPAGLNDENRDEVLVFLDRSCTFDPATCSAASSVREIARLEPKCLAGDQQACGKWGRHLDALPILAPSNDAARTLLEGACLLGAPEYCSDAAFLHVDTADMSEATVVEYAIQLREAACEGGVTYPCLELANWYMDGQFVPTSSSKAVSIVEDLCARQDPEACSRLAQWHFEGRAFESSVERGVTILDDQCSRGDGDACSWLAQMYRAGTHVAQDYSLAAEYFAIACNSSDERIRSTACYELDRLAVVLPGVAMPVADQTYLPILPPLSPEEEEAELTAEQECITHETVFRGVVHTELQCPPMAPAGRQSRPIKASRAPWQAMIWRPEQVEGVDLLDLHRVECGGTLIKKGWILTAAHCVQDRDLRQLGYKIRMSVSNPAAREGFEYEIVKTIPHPWFKRHGYAFDIALLRYDDSDPTIHSWPYSPAPVALDPKSMDERVISEDMKVYAYGWGWTEVRNSSATEYLQSIPMNLASLEDCEELTQYTDDTRKNAVLCAAGNNGAQACFGDSGGGLFYYDDGAGPTLIGVVSAGKACGTTGLDSRYPRVAKVREWIDEQIEKYENRARRSGRR